MKTLNLDKIDLYIKKDKIKELEELGFRETTETSIAGTPFRCYRYNLTEPTFILINDFGMLDICSDMNYVEDDDCRYDIDVFGVANIIYELTARGFLEDRNKEELKNE